MEHGNTRDSRPSTTTRNKICNNTKGRHGCFTSVFVARREFSLDRVLETTVKPCQYRKRNGKLLHGALVVKHNIV
jgi:hypothetical protein